MFDIKKIIENNNLISKPELRNFMIEYMIENNLENYVRNISLSSGYKKYGFYNDILQKINVNYDKIIEELSKNCNYKNNLINCINVNSILINTAVHELTHAEQKKIIIDKTKEQIIRKALCRSFTESFRPLYLTNHDDYIIEYNAILKAKIITAQIMIDSGLGCYSNFNTMLYKFLYGAYFIKKNDERLSPIEYFEKLNGNQNYKNYSKLNYENISSIDKILYGLPLTEHEFKKIYNLNRQNNINIFNYFDETKKGAQYGKYR